MELTMAMKCVLLLVISCVLLTPPVAARPPHRQKRVSDQRLAELETLLALAKMKNRKYVTLPVGYGLIDVQRIGRRKRAVGVEPGHHSLVHDLATADYDLGDIIADLSSKFSSSGSMKDDVAILEGNYSEEYDPRALEEDSMKEEDKDEYFVGGLRPSTSSRGTTGLFMGIRGGQQPQRFI